MVNFQCQKPGKHWGQCLQLRQGGFCFTGHNSGCLVTWAESLARCLLKVSCQKVVCVSQDNVEFFLNVKKCSAGLGCPQAGVVGGLGGTGLRWAREQLWLWLLKEVVVTLGEARAALCWVTSVCVTLE